MLKDRTYNYIVNIHKIHKISNIRILDYNYIQLKVCRGWGCREKSLNEITMLATLIDSVNDNTLAGSAENLAAQTNQSKGYVSSLVPQSTDSNHHKNRQRV